MSQKDDQNPGAFDDNLRRPFAFKAMNISDPLNPNNNLGRSVSFANANRIRTALRRGLLTLRQIATITQERLSVLNLTRIDLLDLFFRDVWFHIPTDRYEDPKASFKMKDQKKKTESTKTKAAAPSAPSPPDSPDSVSSSNYSAPTKFVLPRVQTAPPQVSNYTVSADPNLSTRSSPSFASVVAASAVPRNGMLAPEPMIPLDPKLLMFSDGFFVRQYDPFSSNFKYISNQLTQALMVHGFTRRHQPSTKILSIPEQQQTPPQSSPPATQTSSNNQQRRSNSSDRSNSRSSRRDSARKSSAGRRRETWTEIPKGNTNRRGGSRKKDRRRDEKRTPESPSKAPLCLTSEEHFPPLKR
ncbi:hypothetical protein GEMRC1_008638 [Eukaryota sp. GEM-RC1]